MRDAAPATIYLKDYRPYDFVFEAVDLEFDLSPQSTRVRSKVRVAPKPGAPAQMFLHGEGLRLISAAVDGTPVTPVHVAGGITVAVPDAPFEWACEVEISPADNTALEGLYLSGGMYCTQCEAEGFRRITYYPDRPDVMSVFSVRINSDLPVLLSNGNPVAAGDGWSQWHDPWPKPAYLFALVAGDLTAHRGTFRTKTGRDADLAVWVRPEDAGKCAFAMASLIKSMAWDERVYGRVYDLDVFNIVAVDDFNMGAMENKGLNIFNASAVLASPETSTDANFERIEAIIAHEYFHNWTGNRITCRDWFQLCLKEGLTVFRDAQFTSDMRSAAVKRIGDVSDLRARQFPEDQGPLAHPVRPESFQEINNFYTATVYEKGAELIGMLKLLVGDEAYARAVDLYFDRHDGQACTIEDWMAAFEETTGRDLTQFQRWYSQAGTPELTVSEAYDDGTFRLTLTQELAPSAATPAPQPLVIPFAMGLLEPDGRELLATQVLELTKAEQTFTFGGLAARPVLSPLRGFSAPVILRHDTDHAFLLAHDTDPFTRWEAARSLAQRSLLCTLVDGAPPDPAYLDSLRKVIVDDALDPAFRALTLVVPSDDHLASELHKTSVTPDPDSIHEVREQMREAQARALADDLPGLYTAHQVHAAYAPDAAQSATRSFANALLSLLTRLDQGAQAQIQYDTATNMTQQLAALGNLIRAGRQSAVQAFESQWHHDRLVMDKWFALQVAQAAPAVAPQVARALTQHPAFTARNPNRFRSVLGALAGNHAGFHQADGDGYRLLADWLIKLDPINPQTTARMCSAFQTWRRYDSARQDKVAAQLERIAAQPSLSRDTSEMISRIRMA